jgi:signal transduction histidine kinase
VKCIFIIFLCLLQQGLFAQKKGQARVDSLMAELPGSKDDTSKVLTLDQIARTYMLFNRGQEFVYINQALRLADSIQWKKGIANIHNDLGVMIGDTGNNDLARVHFEQSYAINKQLDAKINEVNNLNNIGRGYQRESDFSNALDYFFKALALAKEIKDNEKIALVGTNITSSYLTQKNYSKATEYGEMTLNSGELAKAPDQIGKALSELGVIKMETRDSVAAKAYFERALSVYEQMNNKIQIAQVLGNLAFLEYPDLKKVIAGLLKAQQLFDEMGPHAVVSITNIADIGSNYYQLALKSMPPDKGIYLQKSEAYSLRALALAKEASNAELIANVSLSLADLGKQKGNYKQALEYYQTATAINDSLFSQDKKNTLAGLESKYQIDVKDKEIAISKLQLASQQRTQIALIIGSALLATIGGLLYWQSRMRKKSNTTLMVLNNQLDEANKIKAKFFGILSHDLRTPISSLINFLHLLKHDPQSLTADEQLTHPQQIGRSAEELLETMETILLWSKEQMEDFRPDIRLVPVAGLFEYLKKFFAHPQQVQLNFQDPGDLIVSADENYLKVIMQNLTSNAIKALRDRPNGMISWVARKEGEKTMLSITDNGPGINDEQARSLYQEGMTPNSRTGFGFHLIRDLARAIQYRISIESKPGIGTTFVLSS